MGTVAISQNMKWQLYDKKFLTETFEHLGTQLFPGMIIGRKLEIPLMMPEN